MTPILARFVDAQAQADSVYSMLGSAAPAPMAAETFDDYRVRLMRGLQRHSRDFKDSNLTAVARADSVAFDAIADRILSDAKKFAGTSGAVADGQLRAHETRSSGGHHITTYTGDPFAWMAPFMLRPQRVRISRRDEIAR
jgi:colicin import membrane protein